MPSSSFPPPRPRVKEAVERFVARIRHNIDVHLDTLAADLVKALDEESGKGTTEKLNDLARAASSIHAQDGKLDMLAKLVASMRLQDEATSIKGILESLARGSSNEAARVAVLLVDGETLRSFTDFGYTAGARPNDVPIDSYAALKKVVTDRFRLVLASSPGVRLPDVPPFMRAMSGNSGAVVPVVVASHVVAVLYAEGAERDADRPASSLWMEHVEVLVRHASSRLENLTSRRTVEVLTSSH